MVHSNINKNIEYANKKEVEDDDDEMEVRSYDLKFKKIDNKTKYTVVFGKVNHKYEKQGLVFFPMYLVVDNEVKSQIGLIEFEVEKLPSIKDEDDDIDPKYIKKPILYDFVNKDFLESFDDGSDNDDENDESEDPIEDPTEEDLDIEEIKDDDDVLKVNVVKSPNYSLNKDDKIFTIDVNMKQPETLPEETKDDANDLRNEYNNNPKNTWIEKFMKNNRYKLIDNEGGGDCFFAVVRDAFEQVGKFVSIDKLRELVAEEANTNIYNEYRELYLETENAISENEKEIKKHKGLIKEYKKRMEDNELKEYERKEIIESAKDSKSSILQLKKEKESSEEILKTDIGYMRNIDNLDKYKDYIKTSSFWADTWAISVLEYKLNIKLIILSEKSFNEDALDSVLNCGEGYEKLMKKGTFQPDAYIMTSYSGSHYKLVSYKKKKIFSFREIPYDIKNLVINKCLEKNSGLFNLIDDFRNLKKKIGVIEDDSDDEDNSINDEYEENTVFVIHPKAQKSAKPGKGSNGEKIAKEDVQHFKKLGKIDNWRRKIDNSYEAPFELDGHKWNTVKHYYYGSKYKKTFPDYYLEFSLDSDSDFSKDVALAKKKASKSGQDKKVKIDPDFYGQRSIKTKEDAIYAKFSQNEELKNILKMTYPAKLMFFERRQKLVPARELMKIRKDIMDEK